MVQIGELAFRAKFDGTQLTRGLMSTRQEMSAARKLTEALAPATEKYATALKNLESLAAKYPAIAREKALLERQIEQGYLNSEKAVRSLTKAEEQRLRFLGKQNYAANKEGRGFAQPIAETKKGSGAAEMGAAAGVASMAGVPLGPLAVAGAAVTAGAKGLANAIDAENVKTQMEVLTGSAQQASLMIEKLRDVARKGVSLNGLTASAKTMLSFNIAADKVVPTLEAIANITAGDSERMKGLALAFSQVSGNGRLMAEELNQMIERGFNPLAEISRTTGRSMVDLRKDMAAGKIDVEMVQQAFMSATGEGGKFSGMLARMSETTGGAFNSLKNLSEIRLTQLGEGLAPIAVQLAGLIKDVDTLGVKLAGLATSLAGDASSPGGGFSFFDGLAGAVAMARDGIPTGRKDSAVNNLLDAREKRGRDAELAKAQKDFQAKLDALDKQIAMQESAAKTSKTFGNRAGVDAATKEADRLKAEKQDLIDQADPRGAMTVRREREAAKKQSAIDAANKKEADRKALVEGLTKPMQDQKQVDQWNAANPRVQAKSIEEVEILKQANMQELERIGYMRTQLELAEKLKGDQELIARIMQGANSIPSTSGKTAYMQAAIDQADGKPLAMKQQPLQPMQPQPMKPQRAGAMSQQESAFWQSVMPFKTPEQPGTQPAMQKQPQQRGMDPKEAAFWQSVLPYKTVQQPQNAAEMVQQKQERTKLMVEGQSMKDRNQTPVERFRAELDKVNQLLGAGAIDMQTAMRERQSIGDRMTGEIQARQQSQQPQTPSLAPSTQVGSAEAYKYMAELKTSSMKVEQKKDPQLDDLKKLQEQQLKALADHTKYLKDLADVKPQRIRG